MKTIKKILIANRGEIAIRIMYSANSMGIRTVAVFSDADAGALFAGRADEAICIGGYHAAESYLDQDKIIAAAKQTGADAIHPGYGFLSENASFAQRCKNEGIIFIGPSAEVIEALGSKTNAKKIAREAGVPVVPGYEGEDQSIGRFKYEADEIGYPVLLKASAGGGGKGMRIVNTAEELESAFDAASREAEKSFGDGSLLMEKYFPSAKHIEFQIFGDEHGNYFHLLDRECSLQRRYQKVIEEAPSPSLSDELRVEMGKAAVAIAEHVSYTNAGTVEFILDEQHNFYFLEVNTRLQVEHPVTESITWTDLVSMQIEVAQGREVESPINEDFQPMGHSIECRICAEDPARNFFPATGEILHWGMPLIPGLRVESGVHNASRVDVYYDSMIAKIIYTAATREDAINSMINALERMSILGITTNKDFLVQLLKHPSFADGSFDTKLIEREFADYTHDPSQEHLHEMAIAAMLMDWRLRAEAENIPDGLNGWRNVFYEPQVFEVELNGDAVQVKYQYLQHRKFKVSINGYNHDVVLSGWNKLDTVNLTNTDSVHLVFQMDNHLQHFTLSRKGSDIYIHHLLAGTFHFKQIPRFAEPGAAADRNGYTAPMPGEVIKVLVKAGDTVQSGKPLLIMNSMKMETTIEAQTDGVVEEIFVTEKLFVQAGEVLLKMKE